MPHKKVLDFSKNVIIAGIVKDAAGRKKGGSVLDLGSGSGRHAIFLAEKGFSVTAMDSDTQALAELKAVTRGGKLDIQCKRADIANYKPGKKFDIVLAINSFHFLGSAQVPKVIERIKKYTAAGGLVVIAVHTDKNPAGSRPYLFKKNELKNFFSDWKIVKYAERLGASFMVRATGKPIRKYKAEIIAKKSEK